jgi:branched-chain amino acid transport system permease protein
VAQLAQHVVSGLASGAIYALLALAIVIVQRSTRAINFAQGELATLSAFVCLALTHHGWAFWPAFLVTVALSFGGGVALHTLLIRPAKGGPLLGVGALTIGLLLAVNGLDTWIWGAAGHRAHPPFATGAAHVAGAAFSKQDLGVILVSAVAALVVWLLLSRTKLGLGLRAAADSPIEARLAGVPVPALVTISWGLACALGAVAGVLAGPALHLDANMMRPVLLYALAAAVLGGLSSAAGAVAGGLVLGVGIELLGTYVHWVDGQLRLVSVLVLMLAVLLVRPSVARA